MSENEKFDYQKKICLLGDPAVGKTSLIRRFIENTYDDNYISTIGTNVLPKLVKLYIQETGQTIRIKLLIWDIAGQVSFNNVHLSYYRGAEGALIVSDLTRHDTLESLPAWIYQLQKASPDIPFVLLANKSDLFSKKTFEIKEAENLARSYKTHAFLTSAKTGDGVDNTFHTIALAVIRKAMNLPITTPEGDLKKIDSYSQWEDRTKRED
ncbi:MAG: GTP-binding protein [Thermoplasmata archaeon]|nr:MAG: GTP-binding protein [Thermoplasmata archaeon]